MLLVTPAQQDDLEAARWCGEPLGLCEAGQFGFVVDDLAAAAERFGRRFGIHCWYLPTLSKQEIMYQGRDIDRPLEVALGYTRDGLQIELVKRDPERACLFEEPCAGSGEMPHHVGFFVEDARGQAERLEGKGIRIVQRGVLWFASPHRTRIAYLDARPACGHIIELIEHRAFGYYLGIPEWYLRIGSWLGMLSRL